jgi:Spy/CpxP family protein refolding chaperone
MDTRLGALGLIIGLATVGCAGEPEAGPPPDPIDERIQALSDDLDLGEEQRARLDRVKGIARAHKQRMETEREARFPELIEAIEAGDIDAAVVRGHIDEVLADARETLYQVADELVALVNSMDAEQRERLAREIETVHDRMRTFHEEMEAGGGRHRFFARCLADQGFQLPEWMRHDE